MQRRIQALAAIGHDERGGTSRTAFSDADLQGRRLFMGWMRQAGLSVHVDAAGNLVGRREGKFDKRSPIVFGSHLDTVPNGGNYDGIVGSIGALEVVDLLNQHHITTDHPLEVIVFSDEEGGLTGSRAIAGTLGDDALKVMSHSGKTIGDGIRFVGGDPSRLAQVRRQPEEVKAFLELHIEQGAVLESEQIDIGIVEGIVGIEWWDVKIEGLANHAGTTPMKMRRDAVLAGSMFALAVNQIVNGYSGNQVGTVGRFQAQPGAPNVIAGRVDLSLEIRDLSLEKIWRIFRDIEKRSLSIARQTNTSIRIDHLDVSAIPALTDKGIQSRIESAAKRLGLTHKRMPSGAGHDAQDMAQIAPTGMIFVPSRNGVSHSPQEWTSPEDMAHGATVLLHTILALDRP